MDNTGDWPLILHFGTSGIMSSISIGSPPVRPGEGWRLMNYPGWASYRPVLPGLALLSRVFMSNPSPTQQ